MLGRVLITDWVIYAVTVKPFKVFFHLFETNIFICMNILHHPEEKTFYIILKKNPTIGGTAYMMKCVMYLLS